MFRPLSHLVVAAVLSGAVAIAAQPGFKTAIDVVLVDLTVLGRNDQPITDLNAADVELRVDGQTRAVRWLTLVGNGSAAAPSPASPAAASPPGGAPAAGIPAGARTVVLVVDRDSIPAGEGQPALGAAADFVGHLPPSDRVALLTMPSPAAELGFDEPRDEVRQRLRKALGTWRTELTAHRIFLWEAIEIARRDSSVLRQVEIRECLRPLQPDDPTQRNVCRDRLVTESDIIVESHRRDVDRSLQQLRELCAALGSVDGPKQIVLVTGGLPGSLEGFASVADVARVAALNRVQVHVLQTVANPDVIGAEQDRSSSTPIWTQLSPATTQVATATGGLAMAPVAPGTFFSRLERQLSSSYVLAFDPTADEADGKPHRIEVRIASRSGLTIRARREFAFKAQPAPAVTRATPPTEPPARAAAPSAPATPKAAVDTRETRRGAPQTAAELLPVIQRMAAYVAGYGANAALFVADERYDQRVEAAGEMMRPRSLKSEFAIVQAPDRVGWAGYRDVIAVDGKDVTDRRDRLQALLLQGSASDEVQRIVRESARFNIGPVARTFNVPTTVLFFFHPSRVDRFTFKSRGTKTVDGVHVLVLDFVETARPTLVMKSDGSDVPCEGRVWVSADDGTVVRTSVRLRGFADAMQMAGVSEQGRRGPAPQSPMSTAAMSGPQGASGGPAAAPAGGGQQSSGSSGGTGSGSSGQSGSAGGQSGSGTQATGGSGGAPSSGELAGPPQMSGLPTLAEVQRIESRADVEVEYRRDPASGVWLPAKMSELYEGPLSMGTRGAVTARATCSARYENYRHFQTSGQIVTPK